MDKTLLLNEIRYAERLCERTARLYRHAQATTVFMTVLGGSGVISAVGGQVPGWVAMAGGVCFAVFGALNLAIRPADKAAANEVDAKRYARLRTASHSMDATALADALSKARETDTQEVEALRDVAYNDVVTEYGAAQAAVPLRLGQRVLGALA